MIHKWPKKEKKRDQARELFTVACVYQSFDWCLLISPAENTSSVQIHTEVHKSLDMFASCLAKAIESDAKLTLFGESSALSAGLVTVRAALRPRYLEGQRLRLESIDEGIVKDDRGEEEQDGEEKPTWTAAFPLLTLLQSSVVPLMKSALFTCGYSLLEIISDQEEARYSFYDVGPSA